MEVIILCIGTGTVSYTHLDVYKRQQLDCNVIHMDDFYLQPHQRTTKRMREPGGNVDYERFETEVLQPMLTGEAVSYTHLARDPRWGRTEETYGEDTYLSSKLGAAVVRGLSLIHIYAAWKSPRPWRTSIISWSSSWYRIPAGTARARQWAL